MASARLPNRLMTTSSSAFCRHILPISMKYSNAKQVQSDTTGAEYKRPAIYSSLSAQLLMEVEDYAFPIKDFSTTSTQMLNDANFTYCNYNIDLISAKLGIPWEQSKTSLFSMSFTYLGFKWNLENRIASYSPLLCIFIFLIFLLCFLLSISNGSSRECYSL